MQLGAKNDVSLTHPPLGGLLHLGTGTTQYGVLPQQMVVVKLSHGTDVRANCAVVLHMHCSVHTHTSNHNKRFTNNRKPGLAKQGTFLGTKSSVHEC